MSMEFRMLRWLFQAGAFFASCFGTAILMRLLIMSSHDDLLALPFAVSVLTGSAILGWLTVRRLRFIAPLRCAVELGVCGSVGGLGLHIIFGYAIGYLCCPTSITIGP
jgi:hypothetical protein